MMNRFAKYCGIILTVGDTMYLPFQIQESALSLESRRANAL
jgi:hypothetical protein